MELLKIVLIASAVFFLYLLLKSGLWRRIPVVSAIFSILLFIGIIIIGFLVGSILIFALLGIILLAIIIFIIFWVFGKAKIYRRSYTILGDGSVKKQQKKPKVKVLK